MKFCTNCGARLDPGSKFCTECGQKIAASAPAEVPLPVREPTPAYAAPEPVYEAPAPVYTAPVPEPVYEAPAPVYTAPVPEPVYEAPAPVYAAPVPEPVYEAPAPVPKPVQQAPAPVTAEPVAAFSAPVSVPAQTGPVVYGAPAPNKFSATVQAEVQQGVTHTYGAPVQHTFSEPVQAASALSGDYAIPKAAEPVAPAKPHKIALPTKPAKPDVSGGAPKQAIPPQVGAVLEKGTGVVKNLGAKTQSLAGSVDFKQLSGSKYVRIGLIGVLVLVLVITLFSCVGGKKDPGTGMYHVVSCTYDGVELDHDNDWIELKKNGKAEIQLMGDVYSGKWEQDDGELTIKQGGDVYYGTVEDGVLTVDFDGLVYTFEMEAKEEPKNDKKADKETKAEEIGYWTLLRVESDDPNGVMDEETVEMMKAFGMDIYVDISEDGTGTFAIDEVEDITWGKGKIIFADGTKCTYELKGDELSVTESGTTMVFVRGEAAAPVSGGISSDAEELTDPMLQFWDGQWYGWWVIWSADGKYESMEDDGWDAYARIDARNDYTGTVTLWDPDSSRDEPIAQVEVSFRRGLGEEGCMVSESGWFYDCEVAHADWNVDPPASMVRMFDDMIAIDSYYTDPADSDNKYNYVFILRPWGADWEDVRGVEAEGTYYSDMMPFEYDDWYLPLIEQGVGELPDTQEAGYDLIN